MKKRIIVKQRFICVSPKHLDDLERGHRILEKDKLNAPEVFDVLCRLQQKVIQQKKMTHVLEIRVLQNLKNC